MIGHSTLAIVLFYEQFVLALGLVLRKVATLVTQIIAATKDPS